MSQMIPQYNTKTFNDVFDEYSTFSTAFRDTVFSSALEDDNLEVLYYLLYSKYGNNPIANLDEEQFKMKLFGIIWCYGPSWAKRLEIQKNLRELKEEELRTGSKQINNRAYNPAGEPDTSSLEDILTVNEQNTSNFKKSKLDAYGNLWDLISTDVTMEFLAKFRICFKTVVAPENPLLYITEEN